MSSDSVLLQAKQPCEIEGRNLKRAYREPAIGRVYEIKFEVDKDLWDAFELIPRTAVIKGVLWYEPEYAEEAAPPQDGEPERGPHGWFYRLLFKQGFQNSFEILEVLEVERPDQVKEALYKVFSVNTLTKVSPARFEEWANKVGLVSLVSMCRSVISKVQP